MASISELKKQIVTTKSIAKITKAMELVATAKLRRVSKKIMVSKPYFEEIYTVFNAIIQQASDSKYQTAFVNQTLPTTWIVINSNLGLCGGYNLNINKKVLQAHRPQDKLIVFGQKGKTFFEHNNLKINRYYDDINVDFPYEKAQTTSAELLSNFNAGKIGAIKIAYTKFVNNVTFQPTILTLLPIVKQDTKPEASAHANVLTEFEPSAEAVLATALPFYLSSIIYSAIMESQLSEQGSRRNAMESATNNANDMIDNLSLRYNRRRQGAITQEILEIVAGANAQTQSD